MERNVTSADNVIGAFSEEHAERLTGVTRHQLRRWDTLGFFRPSYAAENRRVPYSRVYSFRDLVSLRVLNSLRNDHAVSLQHLRAVSRKLAHLGNDRWTATTLYVLRRKVVFDDPSTLRKQEIVSGQHVLDIPLRVVIASTRKALLEMNKRGSDELGQVVQARFIAQNERVFAGTRIPVAAVQRLLAAGYHEREVLREYPDLTSDDVSAARVDSEANAA